MSPLGSLHNHPLHRNHICPESITYNASSQALGVASTQEFFLSNLRTTINTMAISNLYRISLVGKSMRRGVAAVESLLTLKKLPRTFNVQSNQPCLKLNGAYLYKSRKRPQDTTYNTCPRGPLGAVSISVFCYLIWVGYVKICVGRA